MEIKNEVIANVFLLWSIVYLIGLILISIRKDKKIIINDINRFIYVKGFFGFLISIILVLIVYFILVPMSIPFSIKNIFNNLKNKNK
jgi:TM2 domain-containing membrane protein YozV